MSVTPNPTGFPIEANFFDIRKDGRALFEGLTVSKDRELCNNWMNQYPTIFLSFRNVDGDDYLQAYGMLQETISGLLAEHTYLFDSPSINLIDKEALLRLAHRTATASELKSSLFILTRVLHAHYGKAVILLIDEYDVPLAKASVKGYYAEMLGTLRSVLSALKDNPCLAFAVVTGCLQIVKESIFTGTNNFVSNTISDSCLDMYFGFTQTDVDQLLSDTGLTSHATEIKDWYDGYRFGKQDVYCPWDVMNHVRNLLLDPSTPPAAYWEHTSHNDIIYQFISTTDADVNDKFEALLAGRYIIEPIEENLTYDVLHISERNIWTLLYFTGYLTRMKPEELLEVPEEGCFALTIPNAEIKGLFRKSISEWYLAKTEASDRTALFDALWGGNAHDLQLYINDTLFDTISFYDYHENFYHAFLVGQLSRQGYVVKSNRENGLGRSDILVKDRKMRRAVVIETKTAQCEDKLDALCDQVLAQIDEKQYALEIEQSGYKQVLCFGIAFYKKTCRVKTASKKGKNDP